MKDAFAAALGEPVERAVLLAGGASKEAWAVDAGGRELLIRRAAGGVIHQADADSLEHEFEVLRAAHEAGVKVPEPIAYLGEIEGREAFVMERIKGETIGRRIVKDPPPGLGVQLAEELAKIHAIPPERVPFLETGDQIERFYAELDSVDEPHPAIELGLHWVKERMPTDRELMVVHGDWRIGNIAVDEHGMVAVLDWEFAHLVRSGRGSRVAARPRLALRRRPPPPRRDRRARALPRAVRRVDRPRGDSGGAARLGGLRQRQVGDRLPDPVAPAPKRTGALGRARGTGAARRRDGVRAAGSDRTCRMTVRHRRSSPRLSASSSQDEILPIVDDHRLKFRTIVAINGLGIAERELWATTSPREEDWELARRIRAGDVPENAVALLKEQVAQKLRVSNPRHLAKYDA